MAMVRMVPNAHRFTYNKIEGTFAPLKLITDDFLLIVGIIFSHLLFIFAPSKAKKTSRLAYNEYV